MTCYRDQIASKTGIRLAASMGRLAIGRTGILGRRAHAEKTAKRKGVSAIENKQSSEMTDSVIKMISIT
jgi:hypothetical protein